MYQGKHGSISANNVSDQERDRPTTYLYDYETDHDSGSAIDRQISIRSGLHIETYPLRKA